MRSSPIFILLLVLCAGCGKEKSPVELVVERVVAAKSSEEVINAYKEIENLGEFAIPELRRIAEDASYREEVRVVALTNLMSRPSAVPTMFQCLSDSSDTIRSAASSALNGCLPYGIYFSPADSPVLDAYHAWWAEHESDYLDELARLYRTRYRDFSGRPPESADTDVIKMFRELTSNSTVSSNAPQYKRIVNLGKNALPDLKKITKDTAIKSRAIAYSMMGMMDGTEPVVALLEALEYEREIFALTMITSALDERIHLGRVDPAKPETRTVAEKYRNWWRANVSRRIPERRSPGD